MSEHPDFCGIRSHIQILPKFCLFLDEYYHLRNKVTPEDLRTADKRPVVLINRWYPYLCSSSVEPISYHNCIHLMFSVFGYKQGRVIDCEIVQTN